MERMKWTERRFLFEIPEGWMANVLERLEGTQARLRELTAGMPDSVLSARPEGQWSIKEHIGHLSDLEELHDGRINDFLAGRDTLRAADMSNARTHAAGHNSRSLDELLLEFAGKRRAFIARLRALDDKTQRTPALHPRLQTMMKPVDMAFFTAEHDDHHLASIRTLVPNQKQS